MLRWCFLLLLFNVVFLVLLFCINVLERSLIPATSSLMSFDILHASLLVKLSSEVSDLVFLAGWALAVASVVTLLAGGCPLLSMLVHVISRRLHVAWHMAALWVTIDPV